VTARPLLPLLLLLALPAAWAHAAGSVSLDWEAGFQTIGALQSAGGGAAIDSQDAFSLALGLGHHVGAGMLGYRLAGELFYAPQRLPSGAPTLSALTVYPTECGITYERPSPGLTGLWIRTDAGRIALEEPSGFLLNDPAAIHPSQAADGLLFQARWGGFYGSLGAGYLGYLDKRLNRVRMTPQDDGELDDPSVYFAPPRGLAVLRLEGDDLLLGQKIGLFGVGQMDFRAGASTLDTWYAGLALRGPIAPLIRQEGVVMAGMPVASGVFVGFGLLARELVAWRLPAPYLHEAWLSALWASSPGGSLAGFPALAGPVVSDSYAVPLTDIVRLEAGLDAVLPSAASAAALRSAFAARVLLRPSGTQDAGWSFALAGPYVGTDLELGMSFQPLDGVHISARGGALIAVSRVLPYARLEAGLGL
jgi:hypothetical protein